ncbi:MAG: DUF4168 domain-containing protein [Spirulinaceae cyanobacterium]
MLKQLFAGSTIATLLLMSGLSTAQAQGQEPPPPMTEAPQANVNEEDLQRFVVAMTQVQTIQQDAESQMLEAVEEQGLTVERFNTLAQVQQNPETQAEVNVSPEEDRQFQQAIQEITTIRQEAENEMEAAVQREGLEVEEFNEIALVVQQNPSLQQQVMEMMQQ